MFASMWVSGSTLCLVIALCAAKQVTLPDLGPLDGTTTLSAWTNRTIFQYQGIPYAEPPVGTLRFKRPVKYSSRWEGTFNASSFGPVCPQDSYINVKIGEESISEDCLHINVYTTKLDCGGVGTGQPVMVYIHSGFFVVGSARNVLPNYLLEEDVVLAVPQYRLGPLGFLSLKTDDVPGNQGMLDVLLALEWVNRNIEHFGGDPSRVTLFGQSAGAAAVSLMLFSPLLKDGILQRMIIQGGSALGTWALDPTPVKHAKMIAAHANCSQTNLTELAQCLRDNTTVTQLLNAHNRYKNEGHSGGALVVWNEAGDQSFLPDEPKVLLKEGKFKKIPLMGGVTKHEGSFLLADMYLKFGRANLTDLELYLTPELTQFFMHSGGSNDLTGLIADVTTHMNFTRMAPGLIDLIGVALIKACTFSLVNEMSREVPSYFYSFNYHGRFSTYGCFSTFGLDPEYPWNLPFPTGVTHADELLYLFPQEYAPLNKEETNVAKRMVQYWTSFATTGVPKAEGSPEWPKVSTDKGPYLKIEKTPTVHDNFIDEYTIATREGLTRKTQGSQKCTCEPTLYYACIRRG